MSRMIDADALKQIHGMKDDCAECDKELRGKSKSCEYDRTYTLMDFCGWLDDMPTIEPKKGMWIHERLKSENSTIGYFDAPECCCSECGGYVEHETGFCPHCGADMRGKQDE